MTKPIQQSSKPGVSKVKIAVGAASLFLFIVGLKRTFRTDEAPERAGPGERDRERDRNRDPLGR